MRYEDLSTSELINQYQAASGKKRSKIMWELLSRDAPEIPPLAYAFLVNANKKPPAESSFDQWMTQARVLVYFNVISDARIYEDWRSPLIDDIKRDVASFLKRTPSAPRGFPVGSAHRSEDGPSSAGVKSPKQFSPLTQKILYVVLGLIFIATLPFWLAFVLPMAPGWKLFRTHDQKKHGNGRMLLAMAGIIFFGSALLGIGFRYFSYARYANQYMSEGVFVDASVIAWEVSGTARSKQYFADISYPVGSLLDDGQLIFNRVEVMGIHPARGEDTLEIVYLPSEPEGKIFSTYELSEPYRNVDRFFWVGLGVYLITMVLFWAQIRKK
jgi:hypothetical protein